MGQFKIFSVICVSIWLAGCASKQYTVTIDSTPKGAEVICNGQSLGYTPVTRYFEIDDVTRESGYLRTCQWQLQWASGATASVHNMYDLNQYPNGIIWTTPRPNVDGHAIDAHFALQVEHMKVQQRQADAAERSANAAQQAANAADQANYLMNKPVFCNTVGTITTCN